MRIKLRFLNSSEKILHILFLVAIAGCFINVFLSNTVVSVLSMLTISTAYLLLALNGKRAGNLSVKSSEPDTTNHDAGLTTERTEPSEPGIIHQVASTMKSKISMFPVLTEQLKAVINQTDTAAEGLIAAFMGINRQAKKQLKSVQELFGNITEQSDANTLSETQQELQEIQSNFAAMTTFFDRSIEMISDVVNQLSRVDQFALKIKKIGQMTNILALNAAIEAAHSGSAGSGFKVIASEINSLSKDSNSSIVEIAEITEKLASNVSMIKQELESVHKDSVDIGTRTDRLFSNVLTKIGGTLQDAAAKMSSIATDAEVLNKDISKVVVSIQFQDITRQRLEHVISPLEALKNDVTGIIQTIENEENVVLNTPLHSSENDLLQQYTMESEREILRNIQNKSSGEV